jgi:hypothetical protein
MLTEQQLSDQIKHLHIFPRLLYSVLQNKYISVKLLFPLV